MSSSLEVDKSHFYAEILIDLISLSPASARGLKSLLHQFILRLYILLIFPLRYTLFSARFKSPSITP